MRKRILVMILSISIAFGNVPIAYAAETYETESKSYSVQNEEELYGCTEDGFGYMSCAIGDKTAEDRCLLIGAYYGTEKEVTVPSSIEGHTVYMIARGVFNNRDDIKKLCCRKVLRLSKRELLVPVPD